MAQTKKSDPESMAEERAAARQRAKELKAQEAAAAALKSVIDKIASLDEPDKTNAERIHAIVTRAREVQESLRQPHVLRAGTARRWHDVAHVLRHHRALIGRREGHRGACPEGGRRLK
jgi:hypothetical protein